MSDSDDFAQLDDPAFIEERRRVRAQVEGTPEAERSAELMRRFRAMDEEFLRRARIAWQQAS
jgi:hypothetical protein